ncbi:lasso RiPP family leader peptide-containing protein, partial [Candidatus Protofrankia californiensis]|uniref:lasso RiPP family leader peptide-containing protein n=1 Tax=Candidatus Protofrankia californiensis TaxID=1839754 RepID=UPI0019D1D318
PVQKSDGYRLMGGISMKAPYQPPALERIGTFSTVTEGYYGGHRRGYYGGYRKYRRHRRHHY